MDHHGGTLVDGPMPSISLLQWMLLMFSKNSEAPKCSNLTHSYRGTNCEHAQHSRITGMSGKAESWNKTGSDSCFREVCERLSNVPVTHSLSCRASAPILLSCLSACTACPHLRTCLALPVLAVKCTLGGQSGSSHGLLPGGLTAERWGYSRPSSGAGKRHLFPG